MLLTTRQQRRLLQLHATVFASQHRRRVIFQARQALVREIRWFSTELKLPFRRPLSKGTPAPAAFACSFRNFRQKRQTFRLFFNASGKARKQLIR